MIAYWIPLTFELLYYNLEVYNAYYRCDDGRFQGPQ
jgi:hypothetical protein